ncbi:MAG: glycosyl hydrolase [Alistipes sp.]
MRIIILLVSCLAITACSKAHSKMTDPNATSQTRNLYYALRIISKQGVMLGHQDDTAYGIGWWGEPDRSDVKDVAGDYPAVYGWELGGVEKSDLSNLDSVTFIQMRYLIEQAYQRGGINTISWHTNNISTGGNAWDVSGGNVVQTLLAGGKNHQEFVTRLNRVGEFLRTLTTADGEAIPILFRPFHEHTGNWFWWGRDFCTPEQYKTLWQQTVVYLRDTMGLHNLIYVYSPDRVANVDEYTERYPGNEWVDVLGLDLYHFNGADGTEYYKECTMRSLQVVDSLAQINDKPYAFTETGLEGITIPNWFTEVLYPAIRPYNPAYVLLWRNSINIPGHFYAPFPGHDSCEDFKKFTIQEEVLLNGDLFQVYNVQ